VSHAVDEEKSKPRIGCWLLGFVFVNVVFFGRLGWFWYLSEPSRTLKIGPQTTVIDGPLADGYVDYVAALNQRASEGVTPENNAVPLLLRAYGTQIISNTAAPKYFELLGGGRPLVERATLISNSKFVQRSHQPTETLGDAVQAFDDRAQVARKRPWTRSEFPDLATLVDENAAPLALITEASRRPRYYSPSVSPDDGSPMFSILLPVEQEQREGARQLTLRAMLKLGEGDAAGAWEDLLTCHRVARLTGQSPFFISALVCIAIDNVAFESDQALIASQALTTEQARQCLRDLQTLAPLPSIATLMDTSERWSVLDATIQIARNPDIMQEMAGSSANAPVISGTIDWNSTLRVINEEFDKAATAMRLPDARVRLSELDAVAQAPRNRSKPLMGMAVQSFMGNRANAGREMGWVMLETFMPATRQASVAELRAIARERLLIVGFALAAFRGERQAYPESLTELVPSILPELPLDPWSSQNLVYRRTADGFVLYSLADDMQDNGGVPLPSGSSGTQLFDIVLRVGSE
jgi:hypothetical protein